jgi:uncharacterized membrane protein YdjX (TVP38/TMEM64 family)
MDIQYEKMKKKLIFLSLGIIVVVVLFQMFDVGQLFSRDTITTLVEQSGIWAPFLFALIYITALLLLLPASAFSILGGVLFGTIGGMLIVVISATIAATIGFLFSRYSTKGVLVKTSKYKTLASLQKKIKEQAKDHGLQSIIILRLLYLPYMPLSYAAGLVKEAKLRDFILGTFLTNIVGSFTFVFLGDSLGKGWTALIIPATLVLLSLLIPKLVKKLQKKH